MMDFIDRIKDLANRAKTQIEYCETEEATKNALIMPFINALGYDVFNPREVRPEYTADIGTKKGEKVDYAILLDEKPVIMFECKSANTKLNKVHISQLYRYFNAVSDVRFGIVTNGIVYHFYSDLDSQNRMDDKPFLTFNLFDFNDRIVAELKKFMKSNFDLDDILNTANDLKYTDAITKLIESEFENPSEDFVKFLASQVYSGRMTQSAREQFTTIVSGALTRFLNEKINKRLQTALEQSDSVSQPISAETTQDEIENEENDDEGSAETTDRKNGIITTKEEIEGYFIIKSILHGTVDLSRVHMRDTKSYCGILFDDNNRKPICRLRFNYNQMYIGIIDEDKNETKIPIETIDEIYKHKDDIIKVTKHYLSE